MTIIKLSGLFFFKQLRLRQFQLWLLTLFCLAFYLLNISLLGDRVSRYLSDNVTTMLGADAVLSSFQPLSDAQQEKLATFSTALSRSQLFDFTLTHNERWQSVEFKAVDDHYPVHGELEVADALGAPSVLVKSRPGPGEIWLDPRAMASLGLTVGDQLILGEQPLSLTRVLLFEPDRLTEGHSVAMRALIHRDTLANLAVPGRQTYRYLLSATDVQQQQLETWQQQALPEVKVVSQHNGRHPLSALWQRAVNFMGLAGVLLFMLGALALYLSGRPIIAREQKRLAILRSNGLSTRDLWLMQACTSVFGLFITLAPAYGLAYVSQLLLLQAAGSYFPGLPALPGLAGAPGIILLCMAIYLIFQLPLWLALARVSVADLIRAVPVNSWISRTSVLAGVLVTGVLSVYFTDNYRLTLILLVAMLVCLAVIFACTWLLLLLCDKLAPRLSGHLSFCLMLMRSRFVSKASQIVALGLSLMVLIFGLKIADDFTAMFDRMSRANNGNLWISMATPEQRQAIGEWAEATGSEVRQMRSFVYSQLVSVNDVPLNSWAEGPSESKTTAQEQIRLSWHETLPSNNVLVAGDWQHNTSSGLPGVSVEEEVAVDLGLSLDDQLTFNIGGSEVRYQIVARHEFKPGDNALTFWFVRTDGQTPGDDVRYMGSLELPTQAWPQLSELWRQYPSLRMIPLKEVMARIDRYVTIGVALVMAFNLFIGLLASLVIYTAAYRYAEADKKRNGLLQSLGMSQFSCLLITGYEWLMTAFIAATGALVSTSLAGQWLYRIQFAMNYQPDWWWSLSVFVSVIASVVVCSLYVSRDSLSASPLDLLKNHAAVQRRQQYALSFDPRLLWQRWQHHRQQTALGGQQGDNP